MYICYYNIFIFGKELHLVISKYFGCKPLLNMTNTCHNIFHFKEVHICVWVYEMKVFIKQKAIIKAIDSVASMFGNET